MRFPGASRAHHRRSVVGVLLVLLSLSSVASAQESPGQATAASERKSLQGRIVDENGKPLDGAMVTAFIQGIVSGRSSRTSARTNREGEFVIPGLDPGFYSVRVICPPLIVEDGIPENGARPGQPMSIRMVRGASISGKVVDKEGRPLTGLVVEPIRVRDVEGTPLEEGARTFRGGSVDDRGVYRLWGMEPGTYVLSAGHHRSYFDQPSYLSDRARTFYPSSNRAGATEVTVRSGDQIENADITFRGDAGYLINGFVVAAPKRAVFQQTIVELFRPGKPSPERMVVVVAAGGVPSFRFEAIEDGEYELAARSYDGEDFDTSDRKSVRVRGADVHGIRLELMPTTRLSGRIDVVSQSPLDVCESTPEGKPVPPVRPTEMAVRIRRVDGPIIGIPMAQPKANGEFIVKPLNGALYRLWLDFADDTTYLVSLDTTSRSTDPASKAKPAVPAPASPARVSSIARDGIRVTRGVQVEGVRFLVSRGAACVTGRIVSAKDGDPLPSRVRLCLVPADRKQSDDVLHHYEVDVERGGTFDVRNVAPGEYLVVTRVLAKDDRPDRDILPAAWDSKERVKLRAAAEKAVLRISLAPCQRLESAVVRVAVP